MAGGRYLAHYLQRLHPPISLLRPAPPCPFFSLPSHFLHGARVLELGSGTGVTGCIAARHRPSSLVLTDIPDLLPLLVANVTRNVPGHWATPHTLHTPTTRLHCLPLLWSTALTSADLPAPLDGPFDYLLLSDVVYAAHSTTHTLPSNHAALCHTVEVIAERSPGLRVLLTYTERMREEVDFFERMRRHGWCWTQRRADEVVGDSRGEDERVQLFVMWKNDSVTPAMHKHVKTIQLSEYCTEEKRRQEDVLREKLQRGSRRQSAVRPEKSS